MMMNGSDSLYSEQFAVVASSLSPAYVKVKREGDEATVSLIGGAQWLK